MSLTFRGGEPAAIIAQAHSVFRYAEQLSDFEQIECPMLYPT